MASKHLCQNFNELCTALKCFVRLNQRKGHRYLLWPLAIYRLSEWNAEVFGQF